MDTQKIKAILSAIEYKSLSKAADELSYTPTALSHIADNLEKELGVKILVRTPLGISLSKEGEELYDYLVAIVEAEKNLISASTAISKAKENEAESHTTPLRLKKQLIFLLQRCRKNSFGTFFY